MVQTAEPNLQSGNRVDLVLGLNFIVAEGPLKGYRVALEGGIPVYQDLGGPQLETDHTFTVNWQKTF